MLFTKREAIKVHARAYLATPEQARLGNTWYTRDAQVFSTLGGEEVHYELLSALEYVNQLGTGMYARAKHLIMAFHQLPQES